MNRKDNYEVQFTNDEKIINRKSKIANYFLNSPFLCVLAVKKNVKKNANRNFMNN